MPVIYLGLGSNLGDRGKYIDEALTALAGLRSTKLLRCAPVYETRPVGGPQQGLFLNSVCEVETSLTPQAFLREIQELERGLGRLRERETARWGPRVIDIDILLWGDTIMEAENLVIPHPRMAERAFALLPLSDLAPNLPHPVLGMTVWELLQRLQLLCGLQGMTGADWEHEGIRRLSF